MSIDHPTVLLVEDEPAQREVLVLCDLEERTAIEAAKLLGVPVGTVKSRLRLGRARFKEKPARRPAPRGPTPSSSRTA